MSPIILPWSLPDSKLLHWLPSLLECDLKVEMNSFLPQAVFGHCFITETRKQIKSLPFLPSLLFLLILGKIRNPGGYSTILFSTKLSASELHWTIEQEAMRHSS